jgi:cytochrome c556
MAMSVGALGAVSVGYDKKASAKSYRLPAEGLANFAKSLPALFDARTASIAAPGASPAIWSDSAGFAARTAQYRDATGALLAAIDAGDNAGIAAGLASTKAACKACHDTYRTQ